MKKKTEKKQAYDQVLLDETVSGHRVASDCFIKQLLAVMAAKQLMLMICAVAVFMQNMQKHELY